MRTALIVVAVLAVLAVAYTFVIRFALRWSRRRWDDPDGSTPLNDR
jgi:sensor domain CHASE-containing protein